ncbi:MAG: hypothetical protein VX210_18910 [Myxococcota bacterium]|nr:hypothetical protein [Myxococcota bacterium]
MTLQLAQSYPSLAQRVQSVDQQSLKTLLTTRFGVPAPVLENIYFFQSNRRSVSIVNADHADLADQAEAHGIPFAYTDSAVPKLTTAAVSFLGHHATASIVHLESSTQADAFLSRTMITLAHAQQCSKGYVVVRFDGLTLGLGILRVTDEGRMTVESCYPKAWAIEEGCTAFGTAE